MMRDYAAKLGNESIFIKLAFSLILQFWDLGPATATRKALWFPRGLRLLAKRNY